MRVWILLSVGLFTSPTFAASSAPDLMHTSAYFGVSHFDRSTMRGHLDKIDGATNLDEATHQGGFDFTVDADSINTRLYVLDGVLKSEQFLDATKLPVIRLRSDRFVVEGGKFIVTEANLMLHGVTQPVRPEVWRFSCGDEKTPDSMRHVCGDDFHLAITRSAFGMTRLLPDMGDRVDFDISVKATPQ